MTATKGRTDVLVRRLRGVTKAPLGALDKAGEQLSFYTRAIIWIPAVLAKYRKLVSSAAHGAITG